MDDQLDSTACSLQSNRVRISLSIETAVLNDADNMIT